MSAPAVENSVAEQAALEGENSETTEETKELSAEDLKTALEAEKTRVADKDAKIKELLDEAAKTRIKLKEVKKTQVDPNDAVASATAERDTYWKSKFVSLHASLALSQAGAESDSSELLLKTLNVDDVDVDDDGKVSGLEEQVTALKTKYPTLFVAKKVVKPAPKADGTVTSAKKEPTRSEERTLVKGLFGS